MYTQTASMGKSRTAGPMGIMRVIIEIFWYISRRQGGQISGTLCSITNIKLKISNYWSTSTHQQWLKLGLWDPWETLD